MTNLEIKLNAPLVIKVNSPLVFAQSGTRGGGINLAIWVDCRRDRLMIMGEKNTKTSCVVPSAIVSR